MSRKNFVSSDFFVTSSETEAKKALCSLPEHLPHISLLKEDTIIHSTRFLFEDIEKTTQYYVDVSIMSLNDQYVRFNMHVSYTNGHAFTSNTEINTVLYQFEQSIHAAVKNNFDCLHLVDRRKPATKKGFSFMNSIMSLLVSRYHY
jgi:hypothetical protein